MWGQARQNTLYSSQDNAITQCDNFSVGGYTDWRLPNINEINRLIDAGVANSASYLNDLAGIGWNITSALCWTSTTAMPYSSTDCWTIMLSNGNIANATKASTCCRAIGIQDLP
jgi:hypothetical protein